MQVIRSICPPPTLSMISEGWQWSTVQPTDTAVPSISLQVPARFLAQLLTFMMRAISMMSSMEMLPVCLMFFSCGVQSTARAWVQAGPMRPNELRCTPRWHNTATDLRC